MKRIIKRAIEMAFPGVVAEVKKARATRALQADTMQKMLDANNKLREKGLDVERINDKMHSSLWSYKRGRYESAVVMLP